jgi:glycosyltransferase involved in cell wall biosynthesis
MRIGFIEDTHLHGGTQIWVTEANRHFLSRGHEVTLLAPTGSWMVEQCSATGADVATYDWGGVVAQDDGGRAIWTDAMRGCDVAVCTVHPPREGFHCSVFAAQCIRHAGLLTHLIPKTGTIVPEYLREFYMPDEAIRSSVIAITEFTRDYLIDSYGVPPEKVALIYQGTDIRRMTPCPEDRAESRVRYPLPDRAAPVLGCVGSFEHRKGQPVLLEAVSRLVTGPLPNLHLVLVGDGPDEQMLKEQVQSMGLRDHVTFFPFTSEPKFIFERIDITVLSSTHKEGLPNVLLESLAMNVPVVSSNVGGVREVVFEGETGFMVEPGNSDQLAAAIHRLWGDQEAYRRMAKRGRALMEERFDKHAQFDRFLEYFQSCVGAPT